jgi:hypothetical protein
VDKKEIAKYAAVAVLALAAIVLLFRTTMRDTRPREWYYDLSEARLYAAPRGSIAPLPGIGGAANDGVEAIVVAPEGKCGDAGARRIAYLVTYTEEYKRLKEEAAKTGKPNETADRAYQAKSTRIKRVSDPDWFEATSEEAMKIVTEWQSERDPAGPLRVCLPPG